MIEILNQAIPRNIVIVALSEQTELSFPDELIMQLKKIDDLIMFLDDEPLFRYKDCLYLLPSSKRHYVLFASGYAKWRLKIK